MEFNTLETDILAVAETAAGVAVADPILEVVAVPAEGALGLGVVVDAEVDQLGQLDCHEGSDFADQVAGGDVGDQQEDAPSAALVQDLVAVVAVLCDVVVH